MPNGKNKGVPADVLAAFGETDNSNVPSDVLAAFGEKKNQSGNGSFTGLGTPTSPSQSPNGNGITSAKEAFDVTNVLPVDSRLDDVERQQFIAQKGNIQPLAQQKEIVDGIIAQRNNPIVKYNNAKTFLTQDIENTYQQAKEIQSQNGVLPASAIPSIFNATNVLDQPDPSKLKQEVTDESDNILTDKIPSIQYANQRKQQIDLQIKDLKDRQYVTVADDPTNRIPVLNFDELQNQIDDLASYKSKLIDYTSPIAKVQVYKTIVTAPEKSKNPYFDMGLKYRALDNPIEAENKINNIQTLADGTRNKNLVAIENYGYEADGLNMAADAAKILQANGKIDTNTYNAQIGDIQQKQAQLDVKYPEVRIQRIKGALGQIIDRNRKANETAIDVGGGGLGLMKSLYENIISAAPSKTEIDDAVNELNDKGANITKEEAESFINRVPDIGNTALIGRAIGGTGKLVGNIGGTLRLINQNQLESGKYILEQQFANTPEKAIEQPQTIIGTEKGQDFLKPVENPKAGLHNWGYGTLNLVADGVGTIAKLAVLTDATGGLADIALGEVAGADVAGYALNKAGTSLIEKTALSVAQKQTIGTVAGMYLDAHQDAYEASKQFIGDAQGGENARQIYANTMGLVNGIAWTILPGDKVLHDIIDKSVATGAEKFASIIPKEGLDGLKENTVKNFITNTLTETAKAQGKIEAISGVTQVAQYAAQSMFNPQSIESRNIGQEVIDGAIQGLSFLPITLLEGRGLAKNIDNVNTLTKEAIFRVADDPASFKDFTDKQVADGIINQQEANAKIKLINTAAQIKTEIPEDLTKPEKIEYGSNLLFSRKLVAQKELIKDPSQLKIIDTKISELEKANDNILENSTGVIPSPKIEPNGKSNEAQKTDQVQGQDNVLKTEGAWNEAAPLEKAISLLPENHAALEGYKTPEEKVKFIAEQAQNVQQDGSLSNIRTPEQAKESAINAFGSKELVDAAIKAHPLESLLKPVPSVSIENKKEVAKTAKSLNKLDDRTISKLPNVVWHGSTTKIVEPFMEETHFGELDAAKSRVKFRKEATTNFNAEEHYYPFILDIKNPKRVPDADYAWKEAIEQAKKEGYDGLVYSNNNEGNGGNSYVPFDKSQILTVAEAYHKAKADGSNPELVKAVENILPKSENKEAVSIENKNAETEIKKINDERDAEIKKVSKPDLKMNFVSAKELVDSKDPISNKEKHNVIKEKFKELQKIVNCLTA